MRHLEVVLDRLKRLWITVKADMPHPGTGNDIQHAVEDASPRAQDRRKDELLAVNHPAFHALERGFNLDLVRRHVARDFVGHERGELVEQTAKGACADGLLPHEREFVLHQRMIDQMNVAHEGSLRRKQTRPTRHTTTTPRRPGQTGHVRITLKGGTGRALGQTSRIIQP